MKFEEIREIIHTPHVLKHIVGTYGGAFSVGVSRSREHEGNYVIMLTVEDDEPEGFPEEVTIRGHRIPVVVRGAFTAPHAAAARKPSRRSSQSRKDAA